MILAKSEPPISLEEHINDCLHIMDELKKTLPAINLIFTDCDFWKMIKTAIIFHDLGKGHFQFQKLLQQNPNTWNNRRHEVYSIPFVRALQLEPKIKNVISNIVLGHHKDFDTLYTKLSRSNSNNDILLSLGAKPKSTFDDYLKEVNVSGIKEILTKYDFEVNPVDFDKPERELKHYLRNKLSANAQDYWLNILGFGIFKHCDHLGSAKVKNISQLKDTDFNYLNQKRNKLKEKGEDFYKHQVDIQTISGNVILTSPTGSGKTETALLWLQNQMLNYGNGRVFYILPFTASINAMFERLVEGFGDGKVGLLHGKLNDYLNQYFEDYQYSLSEKKEKIDDIKNKFKKIITPIKIITPFQLLKHLFGVKGFEQGISEWAGGYFIFDEIHAYEPKVFAQIIIFIEYVTKYLNGKVLIMTATFPEFMKNIIRTSLGTYHEVSADLTLYRDFIRHKVKLLNGKLSENLMPIKESLAAGNKVLVVCNTVKESQSVFNQLLQDGYNGVLLHSAFTGKDRFVKEKDLYGEKNRLLIGTQAIEVSLDIDYDIIYTEPAPLDALLQRFGRVNRKREKGICICNVFKERNQNDSFIYKDAVVERTLNIINKLEDKEDGLIREEKLQEFIDFVYPDWEQEDNQDFNFIYNLFQESVKNLNPFIYSKTSEEDFYKQFDGIKVVPVSKINEFHECLENYDFIGAESLKVSIRKGKFVQWLRNDFIRKEKFIISTKLKADKENLIEIEYLLTNKKYNSELGLISDEEDSWSVQTGFL